MTGFLGRYEYQLDEKGRVSLPADYRRKVDGAPFVLLQWKPTHLTLFPMPIWEGVQARLLELRREKPELETTLRDVTSRATEVSPDKQGRILIPAWFKDRARLDGGVLLIGAMDRIELWNPEMFQDKHPDDLAEDAARAAEIHQIFG